MKRALILTLLVATWAEPCSVVRIGVIAHSKQRGSTSALFPYDEDGKVGYIDAAGKKVIPPRFTRPTWQSDDDFFEGLAPAQQEPDRWGYIDERGNWMVQPVYWKAQRFSEGLAAVWGQVKENFPLSYVDKSGRTIIHLDSNVGSAGQFSEGLAWIQLKGYSSPGAFGYIDKTGRIVIRPEFAVAGDFHSGLARVVLDGQCYVLTERGGREAPPSVPSATSCGGISDKINRRCREAFIDKSGRIVFEFESTRDFSEGLAAVAIKGKWGFVDPSGSIVIDTQFDEVREFSEGLAAVRVGNVWGFIDKQGGVAIEPAYSVVTSFSDGLAKVNGDYIDKIGRYVLRLDGSVFVQGLAHVAVRPGTFGYVDKTGKIVFQYQAPKQ